MIEAQWLAVRDGDPRARAMYLRHYSSSKARGRYTIVPIGNLGRFMGSGERMVLLTGDCRAIFAWRAQRYRADGQRGVECTIFRNEGHTALASDLVDEACELAWQRWPAERLFTFVDPLKVRSPNPGYCFKRAGFRFVGRTARGLHILERLSGAQEEVAA